jgi:hypothetical protein
MITEPGYVDFKIELTRNEPHSYRVRSWLRSDTSIAEEDASPGQYQPLLLDYDVLRVEKLDAQDYGQQLTAMVFADEQLRRSFNAAHSSARALQVPLRFRLALDPKDDALHSISWEWLQDPEDNSFLTLNEHILFSRYHAGGDGAPLRRPLLKAARALVVIANPVDLHNYESVSYFDGAAELARIRTALGDMPTTLLASATPHPPSLDRLLNAIGDGPTILVIVAHGTLQEREPYLWLEGRNGNVARIAATNLVQRLKGARKRPLLTILTSCDGAGSDTDDDVLASLGARLADAGIPAVITMRGKVSIASIGMFLPTLITELRDHGIIDQAMVAARRATEPEHDDWWRPQLIMRIRDGQLWDNATIDATETTTGDAAIFQVPYRQNPAFIGRTPAFESLTNALIQRGTDAAITPAISGIGGIGKTQLASEFAHRYRKDFPGGVFWLNMEHPDDIPAQVAACAGPGGLNFPDFSTWTTTERIAAVRTAWQKPIKRLLVFDNLEQASLLQEWRPVSGGTQVLVTTRRSVWLQSSEIALIPLDILERYESIELLLRPRGGTVSLGTSQDMEAATHICDLLGDLPLALALAAAYLDSHATISLVNYYRMLEQALLNHPSLQAPPEEGTPTKYQRGVAAAFALSYDQLNEQNEVDAAALKLLRRASCCAPEPIYLPFSVALMDNDQVLTTQGMQRLAKLGLLTQLPDQSMTIHRLIAAFVCMRNTNVHQDEDAVDIAWLRCVNAFTSTGSTGSIGVMIPHGIKTSGRALRKQRPFDDTLLNSIGMVLRSVGSYSKALYYSSPK